MATKKTAERPVMILDTHRGIYYGYLVWESEDQSRVKLERARHCFYFAASGNDKGVYSLATVGPCNGSKIGPRVTMTIRDVSKIVDVTEEAAASWNSAKWG